MDRKELADRIASLRGPAESASTKVVGALFTLSTVSAYVFIVSVATTHEQLIKEVSAQLPIINVAVPIFWFAAFAPFVCALLACVALLHGVTLSSRSSLLERELRNFPLQSERIFQRATVNVLPIGFSSSGAAGSTATSIAWNLVAYCVLAVLPLFLLLYIQASFLPYHSPSLTWLHRGLITLTAAAVLLLLPAALLPQDPSRGQLGRRIAGIGMASMVALPAVSISFLVLTIPDEIAERVALRLSPDWLIVEVPQRPGNYRDVSGWRETAPTPQPRRMLAMTYRLLEAPSAAFGLRRNLKLADAKLVQSIPTDSQIAKLGEKRAWEQYGRGVDLAGRDLRYADLSRADLRKADVRATQLTGANLANAHLDFINGQPWSEGECGRLGFRECPATMTYASLHGASLRYADIRRADLTSVDASRADFEMANLSGVRLALSDLRDAKFSGSNLSYASIAGANAKNAKLIRTRIIKLNAAAVDFSSAIFVAADQGREGAVVAGSTLRGTRLIDTQLNLIAVEAAGLSLTTTRVHSSNSSLQGATCNSVLEAEAKELVSAVENASLRDETEKALKAAISKPCPGAETLPYSIEQSGQNPSATDVTASLLLLACHGGKGNQAIALGLLRRIGEVRRITVDRAESRDTSADAAELAPWLQLEQHLADSKVCGSAAAAVKRKLTGNW